MNLSDVKALSFDCYGTLIDWEAGIAAVLVPWAHRHGLDVDGEALLTAYADHEAATEAETPGALYPDVLGRSFAALARHLHVPLSDGEAQRLAASVPDWPAFPDSADALASLSEQYQLIILSNVDRASFAGSNRRLGVVFDAVITAEDVGSYKPSARNFDALINRAAELGVSDGQLVHVAQSLFHDHLPARRAGLPTVWINRRHDRPGWGATPRPGEQVSPNWTFTSMADFARACTDSRRQA